MKTCHICGEEKEDYLFLRIPFFAKYKKQRVIYCNECQKMFMDMIKEKEHKEKILNQDVTQFTVSFE